MAIAVVLALVAWFVTSPPAPATTDEPVVASTPVGQDVYLTTVAGAPGRTLQLSGVQVHVSADVPVEVEPLLCVGGSPRVTSDPAPFCEDLVDLDGRSLTADDSIVLRVRGDYAGTADIRQLRVGYREGARWATRPAGAPARVTILGR